MRIGGRFRGGGSNLQKRRKGQGGHRRTATSDRLGAAPAQPMDAELLSYEPPRSVAGIMGFANQTA
jgi:hypothetical protein